MNVAGFGHVAAVWRYDEDSAPLILAAKRFGGNSVMASLATPLAEVLRPFVMASTVITWAPPSSAGLRRRGFDQGRVLASRTARRLQLPCAASLIRSGRAQFGSNRSVRMEGPRLALRPGWSTRPRTDQIVVVDDVITTGSTLAHACQLLRSVQPDIDLVAVALAVRT